jgi:uncharacterized protein YndB with AHSA1/START domain/uncharacterized protein YciI
LTADQIPPIRREVLVEADANTAFEVFTARIGRWWPVGELSVHGAASTVEFAGGKIIERSAAGEVAVWGSVTAWDPPRELSFSWHPGTDGSQASRVLVTFTPAGPQTLVRLEHSGWEVFADPAAARAEYDHGWPQVLDRYRAEVTAPAEPEETWVALLHRPGPDAPSGAGIFQDPRFGWHAEFLNRMRAAGYLVAAGPLADEPGAGLTILRLPRAGQAAEAEKLATEDDQAVASGLLTVAVRPWRVLLRSSAAGQLGA